MDDSTAPIDPMIYSDQHEWVTDGGRGDDGFATGHYQPISWKALAEQRQRRIDSMQPFVTMIHDLDRNESGRHAGDIDGGDPTGVSRGNPNLRPGQVLGYSIGGRACPYVVPEDRATWGDPDAWRSGWSD